METLTCEQCNKNWKRVPTRGRKPKVCPKCIQVVPSTATKSVATQPEKVSPKQDVPKSGLEYKFSAPSSWRCPSCGVGVQMNVNLYHEPTHACTKRLKKVYPLELVRA